MTTPKNPSEKTISALKILHFKKVDTFAIIVICAFTATFVILEISLLRALVGKTEWAFFFEFNGVALSMFGALWTALGVRISPDEVSALLKLKNNSAVVTEELIHTMAAASRFASFGAYFLLLGGIFLCIKVAFFH
jgi:hypothetical protein